MDIHSKGRWPSYALSNFYSHQFEFDGVKCGSMEGFLQSLKAKDKERQIMVCAMSKKEAKQQSTDTWKIEQNVYWDGKTFNRHGYQFQSLIRRSYRTMLKQCPKFKDALAETKDKILYHSIGNPNAHDTILTEKELCTILTELRSELG
ncbi:MAG: hypothetical protein NC411_05065 [Bacteroides sp.]|nr:hypothetical protein [Bacteroides sp.]